MDEEETTESQIMEEQEWKEGSCGGGYGNGANARPPKGIDSSKTIKKGVRIGVIFMF